MNINLNRERIALLRDIAAGLVEARRRHQDGRPEAIRRDPPTPNGQPIAESYWRWQRCGPRIRPLVDAGLVADIQPADGDPGPWLYRLTATGRDALHQHTGGGG